MTVYKKKGERIGVFNKIQNLPPTCLDITGLNSSPFGSWYWQISFKFYYMYFRIRNTLRSRACSCTLWNTCLTVAPIPSHDLWSWTFHLINQSAVARMCCFTMVVQWRLFELIMVSILVSGQRTLFMVNWSGCCFQRPGHVSHVIASLW